jgi:hypothetical protein
MKIKALALVFACAVLVFVGAVGVSFGLLGIPTANAGTLDFGTLTPPGDQGTGPNPYSQNGVTVTASGFSSAAALAGAPDVHLFVKTGAGDEAGLGLTNDLFGENEISGTSLVHIALAAGLTNVSFTLDSVQSGEVGQVWGSNVASMLGAPLFPSGVTDEGSHSLPLFSFYNFGVFGFSPGSGNVLLHTLSATPVPGPIAGAGLPGLLAACGALIALVRRRRQRIA